MMKPLKDSLSESLLDDFGKQSDELVKRRQIEEWVKRHNDYKTHFHINNDLTIDIDSFGYTGQGDFPDYIQFNKCNGDFLVNGGGMTSLRGCPRWVGEDFACERNTLKSLEGGPEHVEMDYYCSGCGLKTLKGSPSYVGRNFRCMNNNIKSLKDGPKHIGHIYAFTGNPISENEIKWAKSHVDFEKMYTDHGNVEK